LALYGDIEGAGEGGGEGEGEGEGRWMCRVVVVVVVVVYCMWSAVEVDVSLRDLGDTKAVKKDTVWELADVLVSCLRMWT
jgi:hypothetical protein